MRLKTLELTTDRERFYTLLSIFSASYLETLGKILANQQADINSSLCIQIGNSEQRWLQRRGLLDANNALSMPVLGRWLQEF